MTHADNQEPKGWREFRAKLQAERDPERFRELADQINRLLSAHEKANRQNDSV